MAAAGCGGGEESSDAVSVSVTPKRAALTVSQTLTLSATVFGGLAARGVQWIATGGSFSASTSASGESVTYTAPGLAGVVFITATSIGDPSQAFTVRVGITDLPGVTTYHNDVARVGVNAKEYALTPALVAPSTFGKLFSCSVDGAIYAQPLWVANLPVNGAIRNVVVVATQHDSVYAFDADANPCVPLWRASLLDSAHGGTAGEAPVLYASGLIGTGLGDIVPEIGITGTPVIDLASNTLYVVSKSVNGAAQFFQRLHALDLATGDEKLNGNRPMLIAASVPGVGDGSANGMVAFDPRTQHQRAGLALHQGVVYVAWASHEDGDPYHGWIMGFDRTTLARISARNVTPNGERGGIWMSAGAPALDATSLYLATGNGTYDGVTNFGDTILKMSQADGLAVQDWFTPYNQAILEDEDLDLGSGGPVLVDQPDGPVQRLLIGGSKGDSDGLGQIYVLNRDLMGRYTPSDSGVVQKFALNSEIYGTPAFWNNTLYIAGEKGPLSAFPFNTVAGRFVTPAPSRSQKEFGFPGITPSVSSNGSANGIVWALDTTAYCTPRSPFGGCGPAVLHAYDATNLATELWNSTGSGNTAGFAVKFAVPTVANGKVYVGTRGNDTGSGTSSTLGQLDVYGLLPN